MRLRSVCLAIAALAALVPTVHAQELPVQLDIDTGSYLYGGGESLLEVYVSVGIHTLTFSPVPEGYRAELPVTIEVVPASSDAPGSSGADAVYAETLDLQFVLPDTSLLRDRREYVQQVRALVAPGAYDVIAKVAAAPGRSQLELRASDVIVPDYEEVEGAAVSSIQLASSISRAEGADGAFVKSGLEIQPNPTTVFAMNAEGVGMRSVPYYAEVYGTDAAIDGESYTVLAYLSQSNRPNPLPDYQQRTERPVRPVDVVVGRFDITGLPSGTYFLRIAALNSANEPVAERGQKLYVVNPTVDPEETFVAGADLETLLYEGMSIEEVDQEIEQVLVVADERFISASRELESLESKRAFLIGYWRAQDTDPNPNVNTARDAFFRRLAIVQDRYREPLTPGYRTERGRVFLKYGAPSEIDRNLVNTETIPYEIWTYESIPGEGRSTFVFADRLSTGNMELIHSDVTGEISRPNWEGDLYRIR